MPSVPLDVRSTADFAALHAALAARYAPADAVEQHWVGEIAFALWQQQRLQAVVALVLATTESGTDEPERPPLPSLATLARYRTRIERDLRLAQQELEAARQSRPRLPSSANLANPARLRWLADRIEAGLAERAPANDTCEPEAASASSAAGDTSEPEPGAVPATRPLNRQERRRLVALGRKVTLRPQAAAVGGARV